ncbi:MAG TPA: acylphosphatase [bacterium]|nr:acylphosphatase [bacterium]
MADQSNPAALHATVSGMVQGVFYRRFVLQEATGLGLCGRVRNLFDGRVEVEAEGDRQKLEQLVRRLHKGPHGAQVTEVATEWSEHRGEHRDFRVDYS